MRASVPMLEKNLPSKLDLSRELVVRKITIPSGRILGQISGGKLEAVLSRILTSQLVFRGAAAEGKPDPLGSMISVRSGVW